MKLSALECKNAVAKDKAYKLSDGDGLYLQVMPSGAKYWRFKYQYLRKEKVLALGTYRDIPLAEARDKRVAARKLLRDGIDPMAHKREEFRAAKLRAATTFQAVAEEWYELKKGKWAERHAENVLARLQKDAYPELGRIPVAEVTSLAIMDMIRKIEKRGALDIARRTLQLCRQIFTYAIATGRLSINPAFDLHRLLKAGKTEHFAAISTREMPNFLAALNNNEAPITPQTRLATLLLMLTFVRTRELIEATWDEIDLEKAQWVIPAGRMKKRREHIVPLARQSVEILKRLKEFAPYGQWVLQNRTHPRKHMSECTVLNAIKRIGYKGKMTGHGFRALAMSSIKEVFDVRHEVIDRQLAHVPNKINKAYDRAEFLRERREMMQQWADYIDQIQNNNRTPGLRLVVNEAA